MKRRLRMAAIILTCAFLSSCTDGFTEGVVTPMQEKDNRIMSAMKFNTKTNSGSDNLYVVTKDNKILVLEQEGFGAEKKFDLDKAKIIDSVSDVRALSYASGYYSKLFYLLAIKIDGSVIKLTFDAETEQYFAEKVEGIENCKMIHVGSDFAVALTEDGSVFTWGSNEHGQLGDGTNENREMPVKVQGLPKIIGIAAGPIHSMALSSDGKVYTWGSNFDGALGDGKYNKYIDEYDDESHENTRVFTDIYDGNVPYQVENLSDIVQITAGSCWSIALQNDGSVFEWGTRAITLPDHCIPTPQKVDISERIVQIATYGTITSALTDMGEVWEWGIISAGTSEGMDPSPLKLEGFPRIEKVISGFTTTTFLTKDKEIWQGYAENKYYNDKAIRMLSKKEKDILNIE